MAGRNVASRLTGLFANMQQGLMDEGQAGNQFVDTFRRSMAPSVDMNDPQSLLNYANYAQRNGYADEAKQYMNLGVEQQRVQGKKSYADQLAVGTQKLKALHNQRNLIAGNPQADPSALQAIDAQITTVQNTLNEAGSSSVYGTATDGAIASQTAITSIAAAERAELERRQLLATTREREQKVADLIDQGRLIDPTFLPHIDYTEYERRMGNALSNPEKIRINKSYKAMSDGFGRAKADENKNIAGQQVRVIYRDMKNEGKGRINDDELTDFLQELSEEDRKILDSVVISKAVIDPEWIDGDPETQRKVVQKHFVDQYSRFYREEFGESFANREAGKTLDISDQIADYNPGMNPDLTAEQGGGKEKFESWYEGAVATDSTLTREEARKMWDDEHKRVKPFYTPPENPSGYLGSGNRAGRPIRQPSPSAPTTGNFANKAGRK